MKKYIIPFLLSGMLAFVSCNKKTAEPSTESQAEATIDVPVLKTELTPEERAAKLGFAQYLPSNISAYSAVINGSSVIDKMWQTPLGQMIKDRLEQEGLSFDDLAGNQGVIQMQSSQYGEDYFVASVGLRSSLVFYEHPEIRNPWNSAGFPSESAPF